MGLDQFFKNLKALDQAIEVAEIEAAAVREEREGSARPLSEYKAQLAAEQVWREQQPPSGPPPQPNSAQSAPSEPWLEAVR